jgi:hypothetical protein
MIFVDVGVRSLLLSKARRSAVTRVFGVPAEGQSFLVTMILLGSVGAVARGLAPGSVPRPSRMHAAIGGSAVDTAVRGIAGAPSKHVPFAGGLIVFALVAHSLRPTVAGVAHEVRALVHEVKVLGTRYARYAR